MIAGRHPSKSDTRPNAEKRRTLGGSWLALFILISACAPATLTRIGPTLPPREADCEVEVLPPGEKPLHPYRDVGMVSLQNCQEYHTNPCRTWLAKAVCQMGGQVAYLPDPTPPRNDFDPVNYRVMVAVYAIAAPAEATEACKEPTEDAPEPERCKE